MIVFDIYSAADRYANSYIVYHIQHLQQYGDDKEAYNRFNAQRNFYMNQLQKQQHQSQLDVIAATARAQGANAAEALNIASQLRKGDLLERTLDTIALSINQGIANSGMSVTAENYENLLYMVPTGMGGIPQETERLNRFFSLLLDALNLATGVSGEVVDALSGIGKQLTGDNEFKVNWNGTTVKKLKQKDLELTKQVVQKLNDAIKSGEIHTNNFSSIVNEIFYKMIGDRIAKEIVAKGYKYADKAFLDAISGKALTKNSKLFTPGSLKKIMGDQSPTVTSVFNQRAFELRVNSSERSYDIEIGANIIGGWAGSQNEAIYFNTTVSLTDLAERDEADAKYLMYNTIMHRGQGDFRGAYQALMSSVAASFFMDSNLGGNGARVATDKGNASTFVDQAQFLLIRGRVYPVTRIIENICDAMVGSGEVSFVDIYGDIPKNEWFGSKPKKAMAIIRSQLMKKVLDTLSIGVQLNSNILQQYAY